MELLSAYFYNTAPIKLTNIDVNCFTGLYAKDWFKDERQAKGHYIIHKRFLVENAWYRVSLRFKRITNKDGFEHCELENPVPFMIVLSEMSHTTGGSDHISIRFNDLQVWHGKQVKTTSGYLEQGIPLQLIDLAIEDLKKTIVYLGDENKVISNKNRMALDLGGNQAFNPIQMISVSDRLNY